MPHQDKNISNCLPGCIPNSKDVTILAVPILNLNQQSPIETGAYSVVVNVAPNSIKTLLPSIYLSGHSLTIEIDYTSSQITQSQKC